jgi:hypothetical protein
MTLDDHFEALRSHVHLLSLEPPRISRRADVRVRNQLQKNAATDCEPTCAVERLLRREVDMDHLDGSRPLPRSW